MIKTLLATISAALVAASTLQAAPGHSFVGARGSLGGNGAQVRPSANYSRPNNIGARNNYRGGYRGGYNGGYRGGHHGGHYRHRYFFGGVPYFYDPFFFGFGYYGGAYGYPYGYGSSGYGYNDGAYNGRVVDDRNQDNDGSQDPSALPKEVQRQLSKRGYYRGSIDGEFGPASKGALTHFQRDNHLRTTGRVDAPTLKALGFDDRDDSRD